MSIVNFNIPSGFEDVTISPTVDPITVDELNDLYYDSELITGTDSDFSGPGNWITGLGAPVFDIDTTVADNLYLGFTAGNQAIKLPAIFGAGDRIFIEVKVKKYSGSGTWLQFGGFAAGISSSNFEIYPLTNYSIYRFVFTVAAAFDLWIGVINANNNGTTFAVDYIKGYKIDATFEADQSSIYKTIPPLFNSDNFLSNLNRTTKTLIKGIVMGDSIMANKGGGVGYDDEGEFNRPPRLTFNNIARRIYDKLKFNEPTYRRIDSPDWTKSSLGGADDFSTSDTAVYAPAYVDAGYETYFKYSIEPLSFIEITVPDGFENFALILRKTDSILGANCDSAIAVTLNGGDISAYGNAVIDTYRDDNADPQEFGVVHFTELYESLPSGANTIRFTKSNNVDIFEVWGCAWWTGNTLMLFNGGHGGKSLASLQYQVNGYIEQNDIDFVLFEIPIMNECSHNQTVQNTQRSFDLILNDNYMKSIKNNILWYTCHPFGDNGAGTNYYLTLNNPVFKDVCERSASILYRYGSGFLDIFKHFWVNILARGGTLAGGEGGLWYTSDGQHLNDTDGMDMFFDNLEANLLENKIQ